MRAVTVEAPSRTRAWSRSRYGPQRIYLGYRFAQLICLTIGYLFTVEPTHRPRQPADEERRETREYTGLPARGRKIPRVGSRVDPLWVSR